MLFSIVIHRYSGINLSLCHKKMQVLFAVTWMELEIIILNEASQTEKDTYRTMSPICGI